MLLAVGVILPIMIFVIASLRGTILELANPCFTWGNTYGGSATISPTGPCTSAGASSETIPQVLLGLTLIQAGIIVGALLGILGVYSARPTFLMIGSAILFVESVPLIFGGEFLFTLLPAGFFLWRARTKALFR